MWRVCSSYLKRKSKNPKHKHKDKEMGKQK